MRTLLLDRAERYSDDAGFALLAEKIGYDWTHVARFFKGEYETVEFNFADRLICALNLHFTEFPDTLLPQYLDANISEDRAPSGRRSKSLPETCKHGHAIRSNPDNTYLTPAGGYSCRTCQIENKRRYQQKLKTLGRKRVRS